MSIRQLELQNLRPDWGYRENQPEVFRLEVTEDELFMKRLVQKKDAGLDGGRSGLIGYRVYFWSQR